MTSSTATSDRAKAKPVVVATRAELGERLAQVRAARQTIGLVPTMGALHAGHVSLAERARAECQFTVATIFVNPTQFGPREDFSKYPRTLDADLAALTAAGVDLVFTPDAAEIYPEGDATLVDVGPIAAPFEGEFRPGHFRGVATVVLKLFNLTTPDVAFFGQKDFQQCLVIRRMVADLCLPVTIRVLPTVRESDGLAMSSRNRYLSPDERRRALAISRSLRLAQDLVAKGVDDAGAILFEMTQTIAAAGGVTIDYLAMADPETLAPVTVVRGPTVALIAARVGATRLIDNELIHPGRAN